jgi:hypothetical protein
MWLNGAILADTQEEDVRGAGTRFLHTRAGADHADVPTIATDAIRVSCA